MAPPCWSGPFADDVVWTPATPPVVAPPAAPLLVPLPPQPLTAAIAAITPAAASARMPSLLDRSSTRRTPPRIRTTTYEGGVLASRARQTTATALSGGRGVRAM